MDYYPLFLNLKQKPVLVIGGGPIALEKILNLLKAGASITIIAPDIVPSIRRFSKRVVCIERVFEPQDLDQPWLLVYGATGESALNAQISALCLEKRILCNTVDDPAYCHFIVPSIFRRGKLTIAISTAGVSPSMAKDIKERLKPFLGVEYTQLTRWLVGFREKLKGAIPSLEGRKLFWTRFYQEDPIANIQKNGIKILDKRVISLLNRMKEP